MTMTWPRCIASRVGLFYPHDWPIEVHGGPLHVQSAGPIDDVMTRYYALHHIMLQPSH